MIYKSIAIQLPPLQQHYTEAESPEADVVFERPEV
jgi:hypothetical protein